MALNVMNSNKHYVARFVSVLNFYDKYLSIPERKKALTQSKNNIIFKITKVFTANFSILHLGAHA